jgi:hypothetical protein
MKKLTLLSIIIICITVFTACSKSDSSTGGGTTAITFSCSGISPKFSTDVQPILNTLCSVNSNCHATGSANSGGALTTYTQVNAKKSNIRAQILSITQAQINAFICWIDAGAVNN